MVAAPKKRVSVGRVQHGFHFILFQIADLGDRVLSLEPDALPGA